MQLANNKLKIIINHNRFDRKIKESTPDIVPIVITGRGSMESTIEAIRLEVADYLEKPVSLKTVENAIVQGLKNGQ